MILRNRYGFGFIGIVFIVLLPACSDKSDPPSQPDSTTNPIENTMPASGPNGASTTQSTDVTETSSPVTEGNAGTQGGNPDTPDFDVDSDRDTVTAGSVASDISTPQDGSADTPDFDVDGDRDAGTAGSGTSDISTPQDGSAEMAGSDAPVVGEEADADSGMTSSEPEIPETDNRANGEAGGASMPEAGDEDEKEEESDNSKKPSWAGCPGKQPKEDGDCEEKEGLECIYDGATCICVQALWQCTETDTESPRNGGSSGHRGRSN